MADHTWTSMRFELTVYGRQLYGDAPQTLTRVRGVPQTLSRVQGRPQTLSRVPSTTKNLQLPGIGSFDKTSVLHN